MWQERWLLPSHQTQTPRNEKRMRGLKPPASLSPQKERSFGARGQPSSPPYRDGSVESGSTVWGQAEENRTASNVENKRRWWSGTRMCRCVLSGSRIGSSLPQPPPLENRPHHHSLPLVCAFYCLSLVQTALGEGERRGKVAAEASVPVLGQTEPELRLLFPYRGKTLSGLERGSACAQVEFPSAPQT